MPINHRLTNPGRPLTSHFYGGETDTIREIPPEFRAALDLTVIEIPLPWDQEIIPLSDTVLASKAEMKVTAERIRRTTYKPPGQVALLEYFTNKNKQWVTRTRTFKTVGDPMLAPNATLDVKTQNLGNDHFIEDDDDIGFIFTGKTTTKEIPDPLPDIFKAVLPMYEKKFYMTGIVADPQILGTGEYYRSETQDDVFNMSRTTRTRTPVSGYPVVIPVAEYKLTPEQQVETVKMTLDLGVQTLTPSPTLIEGNVKVLGDGTSVKTEGTIPYVFARHKYELIFPDLMPAEFRAALPTKREEYTEPGTAGWPVPATGDLSNSQEQVTDLQRRVTRSYRDPATLPQTLIGQEMTEEYGGGLLYNIKTIDVSGALTLDSGYSVVSSVVKRLGNGMDVKETRQLISGSWPVLTSKIWDDEMQVYRVDQEQVVAAGTNPTSGTYFNQTVKAIDQWRSRLITTTRTPTATGPGSAITTYEYRPFGFPGTFDQVQWLQYAHGTGYRKAYGQLCKHTIKTWWQVSATPPVIAVDEIITDTVNLPTYSSTSTLGYERFPNVLHDDFYTTEGIHYAATTPTLTQYLYGTPTGTYTTVTIAQISAGGTGYSVGDVLTGVTGLTSLTVTSIGVNGSVLYVSQSPAPNVPSSNRVQSYSQQTGIALSGGTGTGAQAIKTVIIYVDFSNPWVGNTKIVSAKITPTDIPSLWKVQTVSVVMR